MHVVFINEMHCGANPNDPRLSVGPQLLEGTYDSINIGTQTTVYCDTKEVHHGDNIIKVNDIDLALLDICSQIRPDYVVFTPLNRNELPPNPDRVTLGRIRWELKIPIFGIFIDIGPSSIQMFDKYYPMVDHVICHYPYPEFDKYVTSTRWTCDWFPPLNKNFIHDAGLARENAVAVPGLIRPGTRQAEFLNLLKKSGIPVKTTPQETLATYKEYCNLLQSSAISPYIGRPDHLEHKVYEIIGCGALLLISKDSLAKARFKTGEEYVGYDKWWDMDLSDKQIQIRQEEFIDTVRHYINSPREARKIATAGAQKVRDEYTAEIFWNRVSAIMRGCKQ
jgi:hypothetical protein